jgi:succinate dehydrogenase / fumarate reductase cytochrome b subunit
MSEAQSENAFIRLFWRTSVGRKAVMALTGLGAIGFLSAHLAGNTLIFSGPEKFNAYAHKLHALPFLPLMELGLAGLFAVHIVWGIALTLRNGSARPVAYARHAFARSKTAVSKTMIYSGLAILAFMSFHVVTMKSGDKADGVFDFVRSHLETPWSAAVYLLGLTAVALHLFHGAASCALTLGLRHPRHEVWLDRTGGILGLLIAAGFVAIVLRFLLSRGFHG